MWGHHTVVGTETKGSVSFMDPKAYGRVGVGNEGRDCNGKMLINGEKVFPPYPAT
jgi:hypothetical protein